MSVDAATVKRIGRLARIRVEDAEVEKYQGEINAILGFVQQLDEVNVEGVEPMTSVTPMQLRRARGQGDGRRLSRAGGEERAAHRGQFLHGARKSSSDRRDHELLPGGVA